MIARAFRCELELWRTFWLLHWLGTLAASIATAAVMLLLTWVFGPMPFDDKSSVLVAAAVMAVAIIWNVVTLFLVWINAGNTPNRIWQLLAQVYVIATVIYMLLSVFAMIF
jgi:hypothetical protein